LAQECNKDSDSGYDQSDSKIAKDFNFEDMQIVPFVNLNALVQFGSISCLNTGYLIPPGALAVAKCADFRSADNSQ